MKTSLRVPGRFFSLSLSSSCYSSHSLFGSFALYVSSTFLWFHSIVYLWLSFMWEIWCTAFNKPHFFFLLFRSIFVHVSFRFVLSCPLAFCQFLSWIRDALSEIWQWNLNPIIENLVHWMSDCVYRLFNGNSFIVWHEKPTIWTWIDCVWPSILLKPLCLTASRSLPPSRLSN